MSIKSLASILALSVALSGAAGALAEQGGAVATTTPAPSAVVEQDAIEIPGSTFGGQVLDAGDAYYISISELPGCENGTVLVYNKATGELAQFATASNIDQLVYLSDAIYALTPVPDGVSLIRITDKCEVLTTAGVIDQLSAYEGRLYFLADGKLSSIMPDGSDLKTHADVSMGQYAIVDGTVYFTNMNDAKTYSVNSLLEGGAPLSLDAGCLYSLNLTSGVQVKLLSDGVKSIKAVNGEIYLQNMGESYLVSIGGTEQPTGRLCRFDPATRKLERLDVQGEYSYFPTDYGLVVHTDYELALYADNVYSLSLYKPEAGASIYMAGASGVMVYEPIAQRLTYVSLDLNADNFTVYSGDGLPEQSYSRPTLSPQSSAQPSSAPAASSTAAPAATTPPAATPAAPTSHPTYKPAATITARPAATATPGIIFADSATRRLTEKEVRALKTSQLIYARYEILARNGYVFNDKEYLEYYRQFDWYHEDPSFQFSDLDTIESYNYELIRAIMNEIFATPTPKPTAVPTPKVTAGPEYDDCFIFPDSSRRKLTREEVLAIDPDDLLQARYEILARNGYVFDTKSWQKYYEQQAWYSPDYAFEFGDMTALESYNYELMRAIDKELSATPTVKPSDYEFIFPNALDTKLTRDEVLAVSRSDLLKARYEILARCGYVFEDAKWLEYFSQYSWYKPDSSFKFGDMNEVQSYNYELIRDVDESGGATPNPTVKPSDYEFIFPNALDTKLTRDEVLAVPQGRLLKARYEILARCGYVFEDTEWLTYFKQYAWYNPDSSFKFGDMNEVQSYNYELIRDIDEELVAAIGDYKFIFPEAMERMLTRDEVLAVPQSDLLKARYEILARCGYMFDTQSWQDYFEQFDWYIPNPDFKFGDMDKLESYNYELIRNIDDELG